MAIPSTMKAVVLHGADDMRVQAWPVPELGPGEVLLKVEVASICGTDVKVLHRKLLGQPEGQFVMGHEYAGTVARSARASTSSAWATGWPSRCTRAASAARTASRAGTRPA
jgi:D-arabinose 1-dehydrogenase-like Zn-dependent alcohol dehydrogenase